MHVYQLLTFSPLEKFPRELLHDIVSALPRQDLLRVRLVSRILATAAASCLYQTIPIWLGLKSLERFKAISEHPQLSQYVREIVFSPLRFIDYGTANQYLDHTRNLTNHRSADFQALTSARYIAAYESYIKAQRHLSSQGIGSKTLLGGMRRLPQLSSITVDFLNFNIGCSELMSAFGTLKAGHSLTYDCEHLLPLVVGAMIASNATIRTFKLGEHEEFRQDPSPGVGTRCSLLESSGFAQSGEISYPRTISSEALFNTFYLADEPNGRKALGKLRILEISSIETNVDHEGELGETMTAIHQIIALSPNLEKVTLGEISDKVSGEMPSLIGVFGSSTLRRLRKLDMYNYESAIDDMVHFFRNHASTLVEIRLGWMTLLDGDWSSLLNRLRQVKFLRMKHFVLNDCDDNEVDLEVQDYVLRKTDFDPIVEARTLRHLSQCLM
ncbi:hypothetical protein IMSHALPRED_006586 [Imshaugia aleurites]|uniref:F-box domain-containing protein n=1 Tax=Imshaugia aleurites TaxID=172621 RepID=A0A8H3EJ55_9LECA|nr:hypothetical protein IMSHALPRED_006586 [Imshaugia aleurites]